jgi:hypothetical protein
LDHNKATPQGKIFTLSLQAFTEKDKGIYVDVFIKVQNYSIPQSKKTAKEKKE